MQKKKVPQRIKLLRHVEDPDGYVLAEIRIPVSRLSQILTLAYLRADDELKVSKKENDQEGIAYYSQEKILIKQIELMVFPWKRKEELKKPDPLTQKRSVSSRWESAKKEKEDRLFIDNLVKKFLKRI